MSIRTVTCPACNASANVMPTMTNIKCPSCGVVWDINNPAAAQPARSVDAESESSDLNMAVIAGTASVAVVFIAIFGIAAVWLTTGSEKKPAESEAAEVVAEETPNFRVVDLPESTRKKIYSDYRKMAATTIDKKIPLPKDAPVRQRLEGVLQQVADRDVVQTSLIYNVSEEDVMQIVAEGDAKKWPGSKKPKPKQP